jgi:hypothetical protein
MLVKSVAPGHTCLTLALPKGAGPFLWRYVLAHQGVICFEPSQRGDWIERNLALNAACQKARCEVVRTFVGMAEANSNDARPTVVHDK